MTPEQQIIRDAYKRLVKSLTLQDYADPAKLEGFRILLSVITYLNRYAVEALPETDLCHHARFDIYVDGQYVESAGNLASFAAKAVSFYRKRNPKKTVNWNATRCAVVYCTQEVK